MTLFLFNTIIDLTSNLFDTNEAIHPLWWQTNVIKICLKFTHSPTRTHPLRPILLCASWCTGLFWFNDLTTKCDFYQKPIKFLPGKIPSDGTVMTTVCKRSWCSEARFHIIRMLIFSRLCINLATTTLLVPN